MGQKTSIQITYIGGGSQSWARFLMSDLALCPELDGELVLHDIDHEAARKNVELGNQVFAHEDAQTQFRLRAEADLEKSLQGADFVVLSIEPGPIEARYADLVIPDEYGVHQTVGDTFGPGGLLRALRAVPHYFEFAHAIMAQCPNAWVINYTNPMTLCTTALYKAEPTIKAFGCCHEVFGTQGMLAWLVEKWFDVERPQRDEIKLDITGVNHFTWATRAEWKDEDLFSKLREHISPPGFFDDRTEQVRKQIAEGNYFGAPHFIAFDLFRQFGALGAAGDRHLVEAVPWYLESREKLHRMGVAETPYAYRVQNDRKKRANAGKLGDGPLKQSGEEAVNQMLALLGRRELTTNVNLPNTGQMPQQDAGAIVECYVHFSIDAVTPVASGDAPEAVAALIHRVSTLQQRAIEAMADKDEEAVFGALLTDPQMGKLLPDSAREMWQKMIAHNRAWLPKWL